MIDLAATARAVSAVGALHASLVAFGICSDLGNHVSVLSMFYMRDRERLDAKVQAPFVLAEIRALRSSIFKQSPEVKRALSIAAEVEKKYDLSRADLFIPALDTFCAILAPLSGTLLTGTVRRVGYETFVQSLAIQGVPMNNVKAALGVKDGADLMQALCANSKQFLVGADAGSVTATVTTSGVSVTDTTFLPCQMQIGFAIGAGTITGLFRESALVESRCRAKGDPACVYDLRL